MPIADVVLVIFLIGFAVNGWRRGAIETVGQLLGVVVAFLVSRAVTPSASGILSMFLPGHAEWSSVVAFLLVFVIVNQIVRFIFSLFDAIVHILTIIPFVSTLNRLLGIVLGLFVGVIVIGGAVYAAIFLRVDDRWVSWLTHAQIGRFAEMIFYRVLGFLL